MTALLIVAALSLFVFVALLIATRRTENRACGCDEATCPHWHPWRYEGRRIV